MESMDNNLDSEDPQPPKDASPARKAPEPYSVSQPLGEEFEPEGEETINPMMAQALRYLDDLMSVIPVGRDKVPLISWKEYQKRLPTRDEVVAWWSKYPEANIGIVTGKVSGLTVIDCDSPDAVTRFRSAYKGKTPTVKTPRGTHYYFQYAEGTRNTVKVGGVDLDIRSEGGYVVAPPSINSEGGEYRWLHDFRIASLDSFSFFKDYNLKHISSLDNNIGGTSTNVHNVHKRPQFFEHGRRDNDLFHVANCLVKGGMPAREIEAVLLTIMQTWDEYDEKWARTKIQSALERSRVRERNLAQEVEEFIMSTSGVFMSTEVINCLQVSTREDRKNLSMILKRLSSPPKKLIERVGEKNGCWRRAEAEIEFMDFINVDMSDTLDIILPLGLHKKTILFPKAVIIVAGVTGTGKTLLALNAIRENQDRFPTYYFNSEMSPQALNKKLSYFHTPISGWTFKAIPGESWDHRNIADKIFPDAFNVIDYLEPEGEKPYAIHGTISAIINKLQKGVALITVQKKPGSPYGTGGVYSAKASSLYIGLEYGTLRIEKNRFREEDPNPRLNMIDFDVKAGSNLVEQGGWYSEAGRKEEKKQASDKKIINRLTGGGRHGKDEDFIDERD